MGVFRFIPGEMALLIVGGPGPDTEPCQIMADEGDTTVKVRYQVHGKGKYYIQDVPRRRIMWMHGDHISERYQRHLAPRPAKGWGEKV